jgi:hypothetical protein
LDLGFENMPSGNPAGGQCKPLLQRSECLESILPPNTSCLDVNLLNLSCGAHPVDGLVIICKLWMMACVTLHSAKKIHLGPMLCLKTKNFAENFGKKNLGFTQN